jgi:Astacin (Peptidase family M12A)
VLKVVLPSIERAVTAWSNGSLSVAALETGKETRQRTEGWIVVNITRNYKSTYCGKAYVGSTIGELELVDDRCSCGSNKISGAIVMHEVGHAMGFFHVNDRGSVVYPYVPGRCPPGSRSESERYHSALAYGRTRGNADPDSDHPSAQTIRPGDDGPGLQIEN